MKKLIYVMIVSLAVLALNSCQKENVDQYKTTPEDLMKQNPEFAELQAKCNSMTIEDIIALLEKNGEKVAKSFSPYEEETTDFKNAMEPDPGSITLSAEALYDIAYNNGYPVLVSLMKWHWNTGAAPGVGICAADYAGPGWIYHLKYYWMDTNNGAIHYIRTRGHSCVYDGTGSQDHYWRSQNMKVVAILGKWFLYNTETGEEIVTSGNYIPSNPIIANTVQ